MISSVPFFGRRAAREERLPHAIDVAELVGGQIARHVEPDEGEDDDRHALEPARRRVVPAGREGRAGRARHPIDPGRRAHAHGKADHQRAHQRIVEVGGRGRRPEQQRREQHPQANARRRPAREGEAPGERNEGQRHDREPGQHVAPGHRLRLIAERRRRRDQPGAEPEIEEVRPERAAVLAAIVLLLPGAQRLGVLDLLGRALEPGRRRDPVGAVPGERIVLQRLDDVRQRGADGSSRLPAQKIARPRDVERIVVVRHVDHEGADERLLALVDRVRHDRLGQLLEPGAGPGEGFRDGDRRPLVLAMDQPADRFLQGRVAQRIRLADQDRHVVRQPLAPVDRPAEGIDHVVLVDERLPGTRVAGIEVALQVALVDARDLLGERRHRGAVVIEAGEMEQHVGDPAVLLADHRLGRGLGFGIRPFGRDRRLLVDPLAGLAGRVHQHGARVDELADLEVLQGPQQAARALDIDLVVERMVLAGEIEIGGEVHDAGDAAAVALAEFSERKLDRVARASGRSRCSRPPPRRSRDRGRPPCSRARARGRAPCRSRR